MLLRTIVEYGDVRSIRPRITKRMSIFRQHDVVWFHGRPIELLARFRPQNFDHGYSRGVMIGGRLVVCLSSIHPDNAPLLDRTTWSLSELRTLYTAHRSAALNTCGGPSREWPNDFPCDVYRTTS